VAASSEQAEKKANTFFNLKNFFHLTKGGGEGEDLILTRKLRAPDCGKVLFYCGEGNMAVLIIEGNGEREGFSPRTYAALNSS